MNLQASFAGGGYSAVSASCAAKLSQIAYWDHDDRQEFIDREFGPDHNVFHKTIEVENSQAYLMVQGRHACIGIRGTSLTELGDILDDIDMRRDTITKSCGKFHAGFNRYAKRLTGGILDSFGTFPQLRTLSFHGHSLGAAACVRTAWMMRNMTSSVWLFGCPGVGDSTFVKGYNRTLGDVTYCHQNNNDPVCWVPLLMKRVARKNRRYFTYDGQVLRSPSWVHRLRDARRGACSAIWGIGQTAVDLICKGTSWKLAIARAIREELDDFDHGVDEYVRLTAQASLTPFTENVSCVA